MSYAATNACRKLQIGASEKSVLMRLADRAEADGSRIWLSSQTVARDCCLSQRTVFRCFARLEALGILKLRYAKIGGRGNANQYDIDLARVAELTATAMPPMPDPTHQKKGDTLSPFLNGTRFGPPTPGDHKSADASRIKSDTVSLNNVSEGSSETVKGDTVSIKGDTVSPESSLSIKVLTVPPAPPSDSDILWALLPALMQITGQKERAVGGLLRSWRDKYGAALVVDVLTAALENPPDKPVPWIIAALAHRQRTAGGSVKLRVIAGGGDDPRWPMRIAHFRDGGQWDAALWGPKPGTPGCQAPADLVAEILKEGAA